MPFTITYNGNGSDGPARPSIRTALIIRARPLRSSRQAA